MTNSPSGTRPEVPLVILMENIFKVFKKSLADFQEDLKEYNMQVNPAESYILMDFSQFENLSIKDKKLKDKIKEINSKCVNLINHHTYKIDWRLNFYLGKIAGITECILEKIGK